MNNYSLSPNYSTYAYNKRDIRYQNNLNKRINANNRRKFNNNRQRTKFFRKNNNKRQNRFNNSNNNNFRIRYNNLEKKIRDLTTLVKTTSLSGGPLKSLNANNKKNLNNPNKNKKEIRYDVLYSAMEMYLMGKYYSFFRSSNMIIRLTVYSTYSFTLQANHFGAFLWFPYFYPYMLQGLRVNADTTAVMDRASNFITLDDSELTFHGGNFATVKGMYRLIAATMKFSNTTTNSLKGGSYTIYRTTRNEGQPIYYNSFLTPTTSGPVKVDGELMVSNYDNESVKYLYNGNQTAIINEYGVIDGNTIFQSYDEYMGLKVPGNYYDKPVGSTTRSYVPAGGETYDFNPTGVNVKYIAKIDPVSSSQNYKVQVFSVFEVVPNSSESMSTMTFKVDKCASQKVVNQAKNEFNLKVGSNWTLELFPFKIMNGKLFPLLFLRDKINTVIMQLQHVNIDDYAMDNPLFDVISLNCTTLSKSLDILIYQDFPPQKINQLTSDEDDDNDEPKQKFEVKKNQNLLNVKDNNAKLKVKNINIKESMKPFNIEEDDDNDERNDGFMNPYDNITLQHNNKVIDDNKKGETEKPIESIDIITANLEKIDFEDPIIKNLKLPNITHYIHKLEDEDKVKIWELFVKLGVTGMTKNKSSSVKRKLNSRIRKELSQILDKYD